MFPICTLSNVRDSVKTNSVKLRQGVNIQEVNTQEADTKCLHVCRHGELRLRLCMNGAPAMHGQFPRPCTDLEI